MPSLCLFLILDHGLCDWVGSNRFGVLLFGLLLFFLGFSGFGSVPASSTAEDSSKEPKNGSSNGAIATNTDTTAASTHARLEDQEDERLENARGNTKEAYEAEGILPKAAASGKDVEEPDAESERQAGGADASSGLELLVALNFLDAPVDIAILFLVAPKAEVVDVELVEGIGVVDADQIAPAVGKDGQDEGGRCEEARAEA